jgi:hypothetical protein
LFGIALGILEGVGPKVLIVSLNGNAVLGNDLAETPTEHDFGVGQVNENLANGPLAGGGATREAFLVEARDELL